MDTTIFKGMIMGFILSLPFGPVGIYCMELTIIEGRWKGYITALGMVTIDMVYSTVALLFLSGVKEYIVKYENYLSLIIGLFISIRKLLTKIELKDINVDFKSMLQNYLTGAGFAIVNISSILVIATVFTVLKVLDDGNTSPPTTYMEAILGVGLGGTGLWFFTTYIISHFRKLFGKEKLIKIIKIANVTIFILALAIIFYTIKKIIN